MKDKKLSLNKILFRSAIILLLLSLISGCLLGSTFARYVSKGEADLSVGVAKWEISSGDASGEGTATVEIEKFSPNKAQYVSGQVRSRSAEVTLFTIVNSGDVDAYVSFEIPGSGADTNNVILYKAAAEGSGDEVLTLPTSQTGDDLYAPTADEAKLIFTLVLGAVTVTTNNSGSTAATAGTDETDYEGMYLLPAGETLTVKGTVTWTSDITGDSQDLITGFPTDLNIVEADMRDTWIGENVTAIGWSYSWYAVQASEQPEAVTP